MRQRKGASDAKLSAHLSREGGGEKSRREEGGKAQKTAYDVRRGEGRKGGTIDRQAKKRGRGRTFGKKITALSLASLHRQKKILEPQTWASEEN